jgi:3'-phosphoadenosine 5'-phosphosulfate sulfotransferase (PAPS reductase)/FAD synthetase
LIEAVTRGLGETIDHVIFADTGAERPETYAYLDTMDEWLQAHGLPGITRVRWIRRDGTFVALDTWCVEHKQLPSKAFGFSGCTSKWKQQPVDKHLRAVFAVEHARGVIVERWIGYDADEPSRAT